MKNLRIQLPDDLHARLVAVCTHHGELSHLIRQGVRLVVLAKEQDKKTLDKAKKKEVK